MIPKTKLVKIAKIMFVKSLTNGTVDSGKVNSVLKITAANKSFQTVKILKKYKKLIKRAIAQDQVVVETATPLSAKDSSILLAKTGAKEASFKLNAKMIFGAKITHGDWVYDASLGAKLKQLTTHN